MKDITKNLRKYIKISDNVYSPMDQLKPDLRATGTQ